MIAALSQPEPGRRSPLFSSREHQDAQELFQLVSEYIKKEATAVDREGARDIGLGALASLSSSSSATPVSTSVDVSKGVFDGLTANRRSCCECGYTEAVMHFPFDNWQLTVPRVVRRVYFVSRIFFWVEINIVHSRRAVDSRSASWTTHAWKS